MGPKKGRVVAASTASEATQFLPTAGNGQLYAIATKMLGNRRLTAKCSDDKERLAIIPGKFKGKKYWVGEGTLLMLNIRDYQDDKADVIYIYNQQESKRLERSGKLQGLLCEVDNDTHGVTFGINVISENSEESSEQEQQDIDLDDL